MSKFKDLFVKSDEPKEQQQPVASAPAVHSLRTSMCRLRMSSQQVRRLTSPLWTTISTGSASIQSTPA